MTDWYFDFFGTDGEIHTVGPYDTIDEAKIDLIKAKVEHTRTDHLTERYYSMPYNDPIVLIEESPTRKD